LTDIQRTLARWPIANISWLFEEADPDESPVFRRGDRRVIILSEL
jgi:hypothetical protein